MSSNIFSIEIFIDRIRLLEGEKCLFPSTILKLLDYEPAIISTVDNDVKTELRDYLDLLEKNNEPTKPAQLNELKDVDGNYVVRKGKSILFKANTLTLISEFNSLPLYILICDDYYYPNHLVGVVTIKLSDTVISLARKISKTNHTVSEDVMGKFPIVNLIGDAVGFITMKLRLIYIGANLAPHLQEEHHIEVRIKSKVKSPVDRAIDCGDPISEETNPPEKILMRNIGCQVNKHKSIRIQVPIVSENVENNLAKVGLTIDPNDPILVDHPPMIYNSYYGNGEDTDSEHEESPNKPIENTLSKVVKSLTETPETVSILNELLVELKCWKSQNDLNRNSNEKFNKQPIRQPVKNSPPKFKSIKRSKSVEFAPTRSTEEERKDFLKRISKPKIRLNSPLGIVPKGKGWLRTEPEYSGPIRSQLQYKLTKTQSKRIELANPKLFRKILRQKSINPSTKPDFYRPIYSSDFSSAIEPPIPRSKRNPLVPPLFGTGTSGSVPSFTGSIDSQSPPPAGNSRPRHNKSINKRPPHSPGKENVQSQYANRNNSNYSRSISYDTNETVNEADEYLNLNPVQSNRSPHMSRRSNHTVQPPPSDSVDNSETASTDDDAWRSVDNKGNEYSDGFNQSFSAENDDGKNQSRRYSMASQISQTSEWRTDYSINSSNSQHNNYRNESNNSSPDFTARKPHSKSQVRPKRTSLSSSNMNGGRFLDGNGSNSFRTFESGRPSFNESLEVSNMDSDANRNRYDKDNDDNIRLSIDQIDDNNNSMLRPNSVGADVTSFTKVTKYERSLNPGPMNSNYMGTHLVTSTVASLRTEDSQTLTSEAYY